MFSAFLKFKNCLNKCLILNLLIHQCIFPKTKSILLHNHSNVIKFRFNIVAILLSIVHISVSLIVLLTTYLRAEADILVSEKFHYVRTSFSEDAG